MFKERAVTTSMKARMRRCNACEQIKTMANLGSSSYHGTEIPWWNQGGTKRRVRREVETLHVYQGVSVTRPVPCSARSQGDIQEAQPQGAYNSWNRMQDCMNCLKSRKRHSTCHTVSALEEKPKISRLGQCDLFAVFEMDNFLRQNNFSSRMSVLKLINVKLYWT